MQPEESQSEQLRSKVVQSRMHNPLLPSRMKPTVSHDRLIKFIVGAKINTQSKIEVGAIDNT